MTSKSKKIPENPSNKKITFWKGEVNKLRKLLEQCEKRLTELENSVYKDYKEVPKKEESFREKFLKNNYPKKK